MYKVVIGTLFIDGKRYVRGDMVDLTDSQAVPHGTNLEFVPAPPKPKRAPRKKKVETSED
tara:strand:+ start:2120 stop:2299 length:180 start_codon:yes stop_codon:yes gene_type:complete